MADEIALAGRNIIVPNILPNILPNIINPNIPIIEKKPIIRGKLNIADLNISDLAQYLAQYTPDELKRILHLNCLGNNLEKIEITHLPKLRTLDCSNNIIANFVINAPNLFKIVAHNNVISDIKNIIAPKLKNLNINSNKIISVTGINFPNLQILDIGCNEIEIFDLTAPNLHTLLCDSNILKNIMTTMPNILKINISNNNIESLDNFRYNELEFLDVSNNDLKNLGGYFPRLKKFNCSHNNISSFDNFNFPVEELIADSCNIKSFESINSQNILKSSLKEIYCYENELSELKLNAPNLIELYIDENKLSRINFIDIPPDPTDLTYTSIDYIYAPKIEVLHIAQNNLTELKIKSETLKIIICVENKLKTFDLDTPQLTELMGSNNEIETLSGINAPNLENLMLINNKIKRFGDTNIIKFLNLKTLNVDNNELTSFNGLYAPKLEILICSYNELSSFDFDDFDNNFGNLEKIVCCDNQKLSSLDKLINMPKLKKISLTTNNIICAKYIKNIKSNYFVENKHKIIVSTYIHEELNM